ncbi:hypothetical protein INT45_011155 [Circinella minor]|uniref:Uncharacterized protein n=1 Tax=Circinella minor TaxID=1195481 RepID=A0A8H7SH59_9FUNG|nr:hypothetical protein INT45_011155 [Circinella minor]
MVTTATSIHVDKTSVAVTLTQYHISFFPQVCLADQDNSNDTTLAFVYDSGDESVQDSGVLGGIALSGDAGDNDDDFSDLLTIQHRSLPLYTLLLHERLFQAAVLHYRY